MRGFAKFLLALTILTSLAVNGGLAFDRIVLFENFTNSD